MSVVGAASSVSPSTLYGLTRFLTNTLDNVLAFTDANILALINIGYREIQTDLLSQIMYDWKENTVNGTGTGLINLVAGTNKYAFPTSLLTLDRIEINYSGGENTWVEANPIKLEAMGKAISNIGGNAVIRFSTSNPHYWVRDGYIYLDPIPYSSITSGLKVWCTTLITDLVAGTDSAATPIFVASFHQILAYFAAIRFLQQKGDYTKARELEREKLTLLTKMVTFYSNRQADERPRLVAKSRDLF